MQTINLSNNSFQTFPFARVIQARTSPFVLNLSNNQISSDSSGNETTNWNEAAAAFSTCDLAGNPIASQVPQGSKCASGDNGLGGLTPTAPGPTTNTPNVNASASESSSTSKAGIIAAGVIVPLAAIAIISVAFFRWRRRRKSGNAYMASNTEASFDGPMPPVPVPVAIQRDTGDEWNPTKFHFVIRGLYQSLNAVFAAAHNAAPDNSREHIPQTVASWGANGAGLPYALATDPVNGVPPRIVKSWIFYRAVSQVLVAGYFNEKLEVSADRLYDLVQAQTREAMGVEAPQDSVTAFVLKCQELKAALSTRKAGVEAFLPAPGEGFNEVLHETEDERGGAAVIGLLPGFVEAKTGTVYHKAKVCFIA
ncbi:hypothetical protein HDV00_011905 [Rhizophlyctis rosea]|nr:hypothetical protein HDV00_011905 [Rhizophlyctis rosea]